MNEPFLTDPNIFRVFLTVKIAVQGILYNYMFNEVFEGLKKTSPTATAEPLFSKKTSLKNNLLID